MNLSLLFRKARTWGGCAENFLGRKFSIAVIDRRASMAPMAEKNPGPRIGIMVIVMFAPYFVALIAMVAFGGLAAMKAQGGV
jgi:hypothetical protein